MSASLSFSHANVFASDFVYFCVLASNLFLIQLDIKWYIDVNAHVLPPDEEVAQQKARGTYCVYH